MVLSTKSKMSKIFIVVTFSIVLSYLTYNLCYYIAEKYFFDKFFYQKSVAHGYHPPDSQLDDTSIYGKRSQDLITLNSKSTYVLGQEDDSNTYKIIVIGDSFVWGQGIKNNQRFASVLESRLSGIRPTKIYSLGNPGDNAFDNYQKYLLSQDVFGKANLYIFGLYNNDLVFNPDDRYSTNQQLVSLLSKGCQGESFFDPNFDISNKEGLSQFYTSKKKSLESTSTNYCTFDKLTTLLPKNNSIYIDLGSIEENEVQSEFSKIISQKLSAFSIQSESYQMFVVSPNEPHPNSLANKMYTDVLFNEITTNSKWKFITK